MSADLLQRLRSATGHLHRELDQHPVMLPLGRAQLSLEEYRAALSMMLIPQRTLETVVEAALPLYWPDYAYASRYPLIIKDLERMGGYEPNVHNDFKTSRTIINSAQLLGTLYLLEGSRLGAQVIQRQLQQQGIESGFFASAATDAGMSWQRFRSRLALIPHEQYEVAVESATNGFLLYLDSAERVYRSINPGCSGRLSPEKAS